MDLCSVDLLPLAVDGTSEIRHLVNFFSGEVLLECFPRSFPFRMDFRHRRRIHDVLGTLVVV